MHRLAEPALGPGDELAHARSAGCRALRPGGRGAPHPEEVGSRAGRDPGDGELRGGVADVDPGDEHRLGREAAAHVCAARLEHERGAEDGSAGLQPPRELLELERARAAGP